MKTTEDIQNELSVSKSTIGNWVKTGVIPGYRNGNYFDEKTYAAILGSVTSSKNRLKSRANRLQNRRRSLPSITSTGVTQKRTMKALTILFEESGGTLNSFMLAFCLTRLRQRGLLRVRTRGEQLELKTENSGFTAFLSDWTSTCTGVAGLMRGMHDLNLNAAESGDFAGAVYEYLRPLGEKSRFGAFFTPARLVEGVELTPGETVLDPCAGTGTLLLSIISRDREPSEITLRDIDLLALRIATVNFTLFFNRVDQLVKTETVDILGDARSESFGYVVTNPPWGARLSVERKGFLQKKYPHLQTAESFSIALHNSLKKLKPEGRLHFILPESMLYVDAHAPIRKHIFSTGHSVSIWPFGAAFKGVMSKVFRLEIKKGRSACTVHRKEQSMELPMGLLEKNKYRPPNISSFQELMILEKILDVRGFYLKGKCLFGLGIVTGNNDLHLKKHRLAGTEPIFTGKEIDSFKLKEPCYFIDSELAKLQQVAPIELYRRHKICYRFISNSIVAVADYEGSLILNSANFLIPDASIPTKALCSFLNAPVFTFIYRSLFKATKVLRRHLETMPIPLDFYNHAEELSLIYDEMQQGKSAWHRLHLLACRLYGLTREEADFLWVRR